MPKYRRRGGLGGGGGGGGEGGGRRGGLLSKPGFKPIVVCLSFLFLAYICCIFSSSLFSPDLTDDGHSDAEKVEI